MATEAEIEVAAAAIANSCMGRFGLPPIKNILEVLPQKIVDAARDDARGVLSALERMRAL